jgi:hypothetical protein
MDRPAWPRGRGSTRDLARAADRAANEIVDARVAQSGDPMAPDDPPAEYRDQRGRRVGQRSTVARLVTDRLTGGRVVRGGVRLPAPARKRGARSYANKADRQARADAAAIQARAALARLQRTPGVDRRAVDAYRLVLVEGRTQREAARVMGLSQPAVSAWLRRAVDAGS